MKKLNSYLKHVKEEEGTMGSSDESNDPEFYPTPHMANGGMVEERPDLMDSLMPGTSEQSQPVSYKPPSPLMMDMGTEKYAFSPGEGGSLVSMNKREPMPLYEEHERKAKVIHMADGGILAPPTQFDPGQQFIPDQNSIPAMAPGTEPQAPPKSLPGIPQQANDEIGNYLSKYKTQMSNYGPEQQADLEKGVLDQRNSFGNRLTSGLKGFSDAIMQGVAGAGNPGNQRAYDEQTERQGQQQIENLKGRHAQNLTDINQQIEMDSKDPKSPISKTFQKSYGDLLTQMGIPKEAISKMPASLIGDVATKKVSAYEAMSRILETGAYHKADLNLKSQGLGLQAEENKRKESEFGAEHPIMSMLQGIGGGKESAPTTPMAHPQANEALQWAQANPNDPRAAEILKRIKS